METGALAPYERALRERGPLGLRADDGRVGRMRLQGYLEGPMKIPTNEAERNKLRRKAAATGVDAAYSEFELQSRPDDDGAGYLPGEVDAGE